MMLKTGLFGAAMALAHAPAMARAPERPGVAAPEIALGVLAHGVRKPFRGAPPPGYAIYEGEEEGGTADIQLLYRSAPLRTLLKPRLAARLQVNTAGRTSFASIGAEWRQHVLRGRLYLQAGVGVAIHDGYLTTPDPFAPNLSATEIIRRFDRYWTRTALGSRVLFNPGLSVGVHLTDRVAVEAAFEHFSHAGLLSRQNPGINTLGLRLVQSLGPR